MIESREYSIVPYKRWMPYSLRLHVLQLRMSKSFSVAHYIWRGWNRAETTPHIRRTVSRPAGKAGPFPVPYPAAAPLQEPALAFSHWLAWAAWAAPGFVW